MSDHIHDLPVCGFGDHKPHDPSCEDKGTMVACGEIVDPNHPGFGKALCRHKKDPNREFIIKWIIFVLVAVLLVIELLQIDIRIFEIILKIIVLVFTLVIIRIEVKANQIK